MPKPNAQTPQAGADAGRTRVDDRRSPPRVRPSGATDGITITRWSLGLSLTIALTVVTAAFTLVWNQTLRLGETQVQLVAIVARLDERMSGIETRMTTLETRVAGLEVEVREIRVEIGGLREDVGELADLIRERDLPDPAAQ